MRIFIGFVIIWACISVGAAQTAKLDSRFQSWNDVQLILPLASGKDKKGKSFDKITATFTGTLRVGRKSLDFLDNRVGASVDFRVNKYLSLVTAVLYRAEENVKNRRRYETNVDAGAVVSKTFRNVTFRNRNMYEHRFRNNRRDIDVYRNRTQINRPVKRRGSELFTAFISEEGYYDLTAKRWFRNEFYAGITRRINKKTVLDAAYVRLDTQPVNVNGLNLTLRIRLK